MSIQPSLYFDVIRSLDIFAGQCEVRLGSGRGRYSWRARGTCQLDRRNVERLDMVLPSIVATLVKNGSYDCSKQLTRRPSFR
jgi:hypothetical protein